MSGSSEPVKIITWKKNPLRWIIFYYLVGTIVSVLLVFFEELFFPLDAPFLAKTLFVTVFGPLLVIAETIVEEIVKERRRKAP